MVTFTGLLVFHVVKAKTPIATSATALAPAMSLVRKEPDILGRGRLALRYRSALKSEDSGTLLAELTDRLVALCRALGLEELVRRLGEAV